MSNKKRGDEFTLKVNQYFKKQSIQLTREYPVEIGFSVRNMKKHCFDLGNSELLVECKYYDWTGGGNNPSAKLSTLNEAMLYFFTAPSEFKKKLFLPRTDKKGKRNPETLVEYYVRLYKHFIPDDVEIWEFDELNCTAQKKYN